MTAGAEAAEVGLVDELTRLVLATPWLVDVLRVVERLGLPDAWVGAGAVRDVVWDVRFGAGFDPAGIRDVDVVYFDPDDLRPEREHEIEAELLANAPGIKWDAKNQAAVHLWYPAKFGEEVEALGSTEDGVATWPETATAVAVRLHHGRVEVMAPKGLSDLFAGIWRCNPGRITKEEYLARIERKSPRQRWPGLTVLGFDG